MPDIRPGNVNAKLAVLRQKFCDKVIGEFDALDRAIESIRSGQDVQQQMALAYRILHRLAGSAGTFGLARLGDEARILELGVQQVLEERRHGTSPSAVIDEKLGNRIVGLRSLLESRDQRPEPEQLPEQGDRASPQADPTEPAVLVVEPDEALARRVIDGLGLYGYQARWMSDATQLANAGGPLPSALIVRDETFLATGNQLPRSFIELPIICVGDHDTLSQRYALASAGAEAFFCEPLDLPALADHVDRLLADHADAVTGKVLIVDDDRELMEHYQLVLSHSGMDVEVVAGDPSVLLPALAEFRPDIVLMDVQMGDISGPALARMLRFDPQWLSLPIIYLSAEQNRELQLDALANGGDDFLTKPVSDAFLLRTVRIRCYRARQLDKLVSRDSLTGLLKHSLANIEVAKEHARCQRMQHVSVVAMLDLDHFKAVNDSHGHRAGDLVIKGLANLLRHRLRKTDIIGRYGGEEFLVALSDCSVEKAEELLVSVCQDFSRLLFKGSEGSFSVTLSVGLASLPDYRHPDDAIEAADQALYRRKENGRNGVTKASL
ncbi:diguanylate cyclase [Marinobacter sp.]|uniref:diguanylate cyclase n=1 Tax=Marinobacter sp. TaxID=50741 RepID=UPI002B49E7C8|nr:diguanylate cyclase [Marinobacter sp.]HKK56465.1 diguanylate cyclase [Marinobacter sp.]